MPARLTRTICPGLNIFLRGLLGRHSAAGREDLQAARRARRRRRWQDRLPQSIIPPCRSLETHSSEVCMNLRTVRRRPRQPEGVVPGVLLGWLALPLLTAVSLLAVSGCSRAPSPPDAALQSFSADAVLKHICTLSSDDFEGRGPGSRGEQLTIKYIEDQFRGIGLEPGNPDGSYLQSVPLVGITPDPEMKLTFSGRGRTLGPKFLDDYVAWTKRVQESSSIDAEMIFVGYGVQAPEFQWDDFKGVDVRGKVIVVLINDPPVEDEKVFGGKAMTYYGRWTYKFEKAAEKGAAGCIIIHNTERAGYPWDVVRTGFSGEQFDLATPDKNLGRAAMEGWMTGEQAAALFRLAGKDLGALTKAAVSRNFRPVPLGVRAKLAIRNTLRMVDSHNVIAKLAGSDPKLQGEYVVYVAHWDHFGIGREVNGDKIYHGAKDTASGINMDALNVLGRTRDIVMIGRGSSTLDELVEDVARGQGRTVNADPEPEKGFFYRSDHFNFAKHGVPAFDPHEGTDYIGKPAGWGLEMRQRYTREDYHKPSDKIRDYWDLSGLVQDCQLYFLVGYRVANDPRMPEWKPGAEFKAARDASLWQGGRASP